MAVEIKHEWDFGCDGEGYDQWWDVYVDGGLVARAASEEWAKRIAATAGVAAKTGFVKFAEIASGHVVVLHPSFPPHMWDGERMAPLDPGQAA